MTEKILNSLKDKEQRIVSKIVDAFTSEGIPMNEETVRLIFEFANEYKKELEDDASVYGGLMGGKE